MLVSFLKGMRNAFLIEIYVLNMSSQVKLSPVWEKNTNCFFKVNLWPINIREKNNIIKTYKSHLYYKPD